MMKGKGNKNDMMPKGHANRTGPNAGPESGPGLKAGLAERSQADNRLGTMEGKGGRPVGNKGGSVTAPGGQKYTWA